MDKITKIIFTEYEAIRLFIVIFFRAQIICVLFESKIAFLLFMYVNFNV